MTEDLLNELLKDNFDHYQVMWNQNRFHSHTAHHLGSLVLLGAKKQQVKDIYENTMRRYSKEYESSPHEITDDNWRNSLGDARFCSAYRDYFNSKLPNEGGWKEHFFQILLDDTNGLPLIDSGFGGLLHSIIHIEYAIELNNRFIACEALTMTAVCVDSFQKTTNQLNPPADGTKEPIEILKEIYSDNHAPIYSEPMSIEVPLENQSFLLKYYNQWKVPTDVNQIIEQLFDMSVYVYGSTHKIDQIGFDFVLLHLVTGMNAIRKLQSYFSENILKKLLHAFFYLTLAVYLAKQQPQINEHLIDDYEVEEEKFNWKYVIDKILNTKLATEVHLMKVIRTLRDADNDYESKNGLYLKTAVKTVDNLNINSTWDHYKSVEPWFGRPYGTDRQLNIRH